MSKLELETEEQDTDLELSNSEAMAKNIAAAAGGVPKNFRQQADMEAFYRFVHENDLRDDALTILDEVRVQKASGKPAAKKAAKH